MPYFVKLSTSDILIRTKITTIKDSIDGTKNDLHNGPAVKMLTMKHLGMLL